MSIELRKALPDPVYNSRLWGTSINPNSYYRVFGEAGDDAWYLYDDVLRTGAIRGSASFSHDAYFSKGSPQGIYLHSMRQNRLDDLLKHYSLGEVGNNNFFVEATDKFNPNTNPLYKPNATLQHKPLPSIGGIQAPEELAFPKSGSGSRWLTTVDSTGLPVPEGTYVTAAPATNTTFLQRINPANQRHLRMGQAFTPEFLNVTQGFSGGKPPEWKWLFDYTKDFSKTSIPQHGRNIVHIGKTIMAQPETKAFIAGAGNVAMKTGGAAGFLLDAPEIMYKENKQRMLKNAEKGTFKEATPLEVTQMMGKAVMGSIANAVTLGTAYAGTGEGRPTRGPARMSDSGDEALRRTMERANSWMPKDDFSDVPTIDDDIKSFLR